ncbi:hypothetical protein N1031_07740 [Herbiconiux moechotypicola]|uniref:Uncharacterized protein n=1 Tax=Herbiconiux moechotypicola TaxID=637393 RepID=A0ABN3DHR7_9MICO|nr:hypothetical protein [Herbiconiux moechotypicola]MCS5729650.1 hypothetical protein [Herbiconiux moechotypicola]
MRSLAVVFALVLAVAPVSAAPVSVVPDSGTARLGYTASTAVAGEQLEFAGSGFRGGESVVVVLDEGVAESDPVVAGATGTVSGTLTLPVELRGGTHVLSATGLGSGIAAVTEVAVEASEFAAPLVAEPAPDQGVPSWVYLAAVLAVLLAALAVLVVVPVLVVRGVRTRRRRRRASAV